MVWFVVEYTELLHKIYSFPVLKVFLHWYWPNDSVSPRRYLDTITLDYIL